MYQTNNRQERDLVTAFRMTAEILFAVCSVAIFGGITTGSDLAGDEENCEAEKAELETKLGRNKIDSITYKQEFFAIIFG